MMIDFSNDTPVVDGVIVMPDWNFSDLSKQASEIKELISIGGSSSTTISIGGEVDDLGS